MVSTPAAASVAQSMPEALTVRVMVATTMRKGFLPLETTRGDRLFIGLLSAAYVNLIFVGISGKLVQWFSLSAEPSVWISFVASMALLVLILRKG